MEIKEIKELVLGWAKDRGIIPNASTSTQALKLVSEVGELCDNVAKGRCVKDDIGDCMVVLTIIAELEDLSLRECYLHAWNDIKDRKGYLSKDGCFVKETDIDKNQTDTYKANYNV
jgi:hypothetical protein